MISYYFDIFNILILKINFKNKTKYYFNTFLYTKNNYYYNIKDALNI